MRPRSRRRPVRIPASTYRLQWNRQFTFREAAELADYLDELGVGDCYVAPWLMARPGSLHGYDVTDQSRLNPELGTAEDLTAFVSSLQRRGMGLVLDLVPNHMCIVDASNTWWWDVLENGPSSPFASFFDIDWSPPKEELANKVLLPILEDQYGRVLEDQQICITYDGGAFCALLHTTRLPLAPRSWSLLLEPALAELKLRLGESHADVLELESILTAVSHLPPRTETAEDKVRERRREKEIIKRRLAALTEASEAVRGTLERLVREINGVPGEPRSFDRLEKLLAEQAYRLSYWRVAADEINYRRFFDVNELATIRVEDPEVFSAVHALTFELIRQGLVTGLRVDHLDGLFDPERYLHDLQAGSLAAWAAREGREMTEPGRSFYIVAEKILTGDEELRPSWPFEGTTGYGFLNDLNGLFVNRAARRAFVRLYTRFTGRSQDFDDLVYECKKLLLQVSMSSELSVLARRLDRISEQHRWSRDFTLNSLRDALGEVVACFPIYRTYVRTGATQVDAEDQRHIEAAVAEAKRRNPAISESIFDFIRGMVLLEDPAGLTDAQRAERRLFVMRFQQLTGPVMAKGWEDTAYYRYFPLASFNEVGGDPRRFGVPLSRFHGKNRIRLANWPNAMLATCTHDTKRSEDVRARINVLSEIPAEWSRALRSWHDLNLRHKARLGGEEAPSRDDEYLLYQTLVGTFPPTPLTAEEQVDYTARIENYMRKAAREAKVHTSWISPNAAYEEALSSFIRRVLEDSPENLFLREFASFQAHIVRAGMLNSLSQVVLKIASPGVPDFYQGSEIWDYSLVDPDNRRPVDFALRRCLLEKLRPGADEDAPDLVPRLTERLVDGAIKLYVTQRGLRFRRANRDLFASGDYVPLRADGSRRNHVVAFARRLGRRWVIALAGRFFMALGADQRLPLGTEAWGDSVLLLRGPLTDTGYRDVFTLRRVSPERRGNKLTLPLAAVFSHLTVALLATEDVAGWP